MITMVINHLEVMGNNLTKNARLKANLKQWKNLRNCHHQDDIR